MKNPIDFSKIYHVGTLFYTFPQLMCVCFWLVLGFFSYFLLECQLIPVVMPLALKELGASGAQTGIIVGTIPMLINIVLCPIVSTASDRTRTRIGRRMPFIILTAPVISFFAILLGWLPELRGFIETNIHWMEPDRLMLLLYAVVYVLFYTADMGVGTAIWYLAPDVVPQEFIGRISAASSIVGAFAGFIFNRFLLGFVPQYNKWLFTVIGLWFAIILTGMLFFVKEGEYPPPEVSKNSRKNLFGRGVSAVKHFFCDCVSDKLILFFFFGYSMTCVSTKCRGLFNILFATRDIGLTTGQYGVVMGYGSLLGLGVSFLSSFWIDRINPLMFYTYIGIVIIILNVFGYFFAMDYASFMWIGLMITVVYTVQNLCQNKIFVMLYPKARYGQFCSAMTIFLSVISSVTTWGAGKAVDLFGYRFIFVWDFVFTIIATLILLEVIRRWKIRQKTEVQGEAWNISTQQTVDCC